MTAEKDMRPPLNGQNISILKGDSLALMKSLPEALVSLILTDSPYCRMRHMKAARARHFMHDLPYLDWMGEHFKEWKRVLKPNGSLTLFCSSYMAARLEVKVSHFFNILSSIVWVKPGFPAAPGARAMPGHVPQRHWHPHGERIIFAEPIYGSAPGGNYGAIFLRDQRTKAGFTKKDLTIALSATGVAVHGQKVSAWEAGKEIPSPEEFHNLQKCYWNAGQKDDWPEYESLFRHFELGDGHNASDIWHHQHDHSAPQNQHHEKPLDMLEYIIKSTTRENDIVLDCFASSGNVGVAALKINRKAILLESIAI